VPTEHDVKRLVQVVLQPERDDAKKRLDNTGYWGDTGYWVLRAVIEVERAIYRGSQFLDRPHDLWLREVIRETEAAHQTYRQEEEDPDGYGSATLHQCLARLRQISEDLEAALAKSKPDE